LEQVQSRVRQWFPGGFVGPRPANKRTGKLLSISMMQSRILVLLALCCGAVPVSVQAQMAPSSESQAWLRTAIATGKFSDLRWPDFSDYSKPPSTLSATQSKRSTLVPDISVG
jgi:hypothetical protein